ncbi:SDR family oxidoreductase [soil metagenome]
MRIFLTGATGFIGSHIIPELLQAGHSVVGVTRSDTGVDTLRAAGVEPYRGTLEDPAGLAKGADQADAVIHCAFDHDFSNFAAVVEKDIGVINAVGQILKDSDRPFIVTSGVGFGSSEAGATAVEAVLNPDSPNPRVRSEMEAAALLDAGVKVITMRLPQVHDTVKQGLISPMILISRAQGRSAYVGAGTTRLSAAHVSDVAHLYRLAVEQGRAGERFNAVDEEGVPLVDVATAVGEGLNVPVVSLTPEEVPGHFGMFGMFASMDLPASSAWTRERLGWRPRGPGLIADLKALDYSVPT